MSIDKYDDGHVERLKSILNQNEFKLNLAAVLHEGQNYKLLTKYREQVILKKTIEFGLSITQSSVRHNAGQPALHRVKQLKHIQVQDQKKKKDNKKSLHTQVYTVEMGKYTKINKEKKK